MDLQPKYPEGTPEYERYAAELRAELVKFAKGEPPYDACPRCVFSETTGLRSCDAPHRLTMGEHE
jgi:hypothetical protein